MSNNGYTEIALSQQALSKFLIQAGMTENELIKYQTLTEQIHSENEQVYLLRSLRTRLLSKLHCQQDLLTKLDYIIYLTEERS